MDEKTKEIVERLLKRTRSVAVARQPFCSQQIPDEDCHEAASLIESLSERVGELEREKQKLRGALKPLAAAYDIWVGHPDNMPLKIARIGPGDDADLTMANLCEAHALSNQGEGS